MDKKRKLKTEWKYWVGDANGRPNSFWAELYSKWTPLVLFTVGEYINTGNHFADEDFEDAFQCAWIKIMRGWDSCRKSGIATWIHETAKHATVDFIRRVRRSLKGVSIDDCPDLERSVFAHGLTAADGEAATRYQELWDCIAELPAESSDLLLYAAQGHSGKEIAEQFAIEPAAARQRLHRCRSDLKKRIHLRRIPGHRRWSRAKTEGKKDASF